MKRARSSVKSPANPGVDAARRPCAGTQVVVRAPVRGSGPADVHPRGAVGVVTRTPVGDEVHYTVLFPDGFESAFTLAELDILKHVKDRLGDAGAGMAGFDLERLLIYRCVVGSRAYGLDTDDSDVDRRGVYLAPAELQWSLYGAPEQFEDNTTQSCYWELQKFLVQALKANPNILECLYSPLVELVTPLGEELLAIRSAFLSQMIFQTFNGYALSQFKKLEQDRRNRSSRRKAIPATNATSTEGSQAAPDLTTSFGAAGSGEVRRKHAMHLLRLLLTGAATLREGRVPVRVADAHRDRLLAVKRGELPWPEVDAWRLDLHRDFERALAETALPERPDYEAANRLLIRARRKFAIGPDAHSDQCGER